MEKCISSLTEALSKQNTQGTSHIDDDTLVVENSMERHVRNVDKNNVSVNVARQTPRPAASDVATPRQLISWGDHDVEPESYNADFRDSINDFDMNYLCNNDDYCEQVEYNPGSIG